MGDSLFAPVKFIGVTLVALAIALRLSNDFGSTEKRIVTLSVALHAIAAIGEEVIFRYVYGGGDMFAYQLYGGLLSRYISLDPGEHLGQVIALVFQADVRLPFMVPGVGTSTGSMCGIGGLLSYFLSNSLYVIGATIGGGSAIGQILIYRLIRAELPPSFRTRAIVACLLLPSVVFWSSALLKEAVIMLPAAIAIVGLSKAATGSKAQGALLVVLGCIPIALLKPYVLAGVFVGGPVYIIARRAVHQKGRIRFSFSQMAASAIVVPVFLVLFGRLFSQFDVEELGQHLAQQQEATLAVAGASTYSLVTPGSTSLAGQLAFAPLAVFTAFFRPLVFEAHNAQALANAIEATALLGLTVQAFFRRGYRGIIDTIARYPILIFFFVFSAVLGLGVGLATTNMGALSRYRIPMYSEFAILVAVLAARKSVKKPATQKPAETGRPTEPLHSP